MDSPVDKSWTKVGQYWTKAGRPLDSPVDKKKF